MPTLIAKLSVKQVLAEVKLVAARHCIPAVVDAQMCDAQGMYSRTAIVTLEDNTRVVVQLKDNEIDFTKVILANSLLGDVVPLVHPVPTEKAHFAYVANFIPGTIWSDKETTVAEDARISSQIGNLISKCSLEFDSTGLVERYVIPRLQLIVAKEDLSDPAIKTRIEGLISKANDLKSLPLSLCHWDINSRNILLDDNQDVTGLIDWEAAILLPLGMNTWCIRFLAVPITHGRDAPIVDGPDRISDGARAMARGFWDGLVQNIPSKLKRNVVTAMEVGMVLQTFHGLGEPDLGYFTERMDWIPKTFEPFCAQ